MRQSDLFDIFFNKLKKRCIPMILVLLMLLWQVIGVFILRIFGINYNNFNEVLKVLFMFSLDLLFIGLLIFIYRKSFFRDFKNFFNRQVFSNISLSFKYWLIGFLIMVFSNFIIAIITNGTLASNEEAVRDLIDKYPIYMAFQVMFYAPLTEEVIFRKSIKDAVNNKYLYVIISGLIFGGLHVISSINGLIDLIYLIPYCTLGFVFAYLYTKTNNIFSTITAHSFHNTLALILYLVA